MSDYDMAKKALATTRTMCSMLSGILPELAYQCERGHLTPPEIGQRLREWGEKAAKATLKSISEEFAATALETR